MTKNGSVRESGNGLKVEQYRLSMQEIGCRIRGGRYRMRFGITKFQHYSLDVEGRGGELNDLMRYY